VPQVDWTDGSYFLYKDYPRPLVSPENVCLPLDPLRPPLLHPFTVFPRLRSPRGFLLRPLGFRGEVSGQATVRSFRAPRRRVGRRRPTLPGLVDILCVFSSYTLTHKSKYLSFAGGCAQLEQLEALVARKPSIRARTDGDLVRLDGVCLFPNPRWAESTCGYSGVRLVSPPCPQADDVRSQLRAKRIDSRFWKPIQFQRPYKSVPQPEQGGVEGSWQTGLTLPCSTRLTKRD